MKKLTSLFYIFLGLVVVSGRGGAEDLPENFKKLIKKHHFSEGGLSLYVEDEGKGVFALNEEKLMIPASLTKIVTGGAVLSKVSINKKFVTEIWGKGNVEGGNLKGALCLKGGGDPSFVSEKMWFLVNEFFRTGIKNIEGDLIVDASRFDDELFDSGRDKNRVDRAFDAPISALSFNWNSGNIFIRPGVKEGDPAVVTLDPMSDYFELENKTKTVQKDGIKRISVSRIARSKGDKIIVSGQISKNIPEFVVYKNISNPVLWTASHLREFFRQRGMAIKGETKVGECEADSKLLASVNSKNLNEMISDMLKFSNNYVAEMLVKNLAAEYQLPNSMPKKASMKDGLEAIKTYLDKLGIQRKDYSLENVSGLTRGNKFSAKQLAIILGNIKNDFLIYPEFLSGLPIAGLDGTMKNRLKGSPSTLVRAKTGYLDGVVGLAGYIGRKDKGPLIFVFMFNGASEQGIEAKALFDDFVGELLKL